jgi:hypothetical protein
VAAYRTAAEKLQRGDPAARFPLGSFPPALPFVATGYSYDRITAAVTPRPLSPEIWSRAEPVELDFDPRLYQDCTAEERSYGRAVRPAIPTAPAPPVSPHPHRGRG